MNYSGIGGEFFRDMHPKKATLLAQAAYGRQLGWVRRSYAPSQTKTGKATRPQHVQCIVLEA